jgi:hypothetical protein
MAAGLQANAKPNRVNVLEAYKLRTINQLTYDQIGELQGVKGPSVFEALKRFTASLPSDDQLQGFTDARAELLNATSQTLLASLSDPDVLAKANLRDRAVTFGIIYDKHRLETAQSTSNISVLSKLISQADTGLFKTQAGSQAAPCLDETHATGETSSKDIKEL